MKKIRPVGKWIAVKTQGLGIEKKTESGIIYKEKITNPNMVSEDIRIGDRVLWDLTKNTTRVGYQSCDLIHQDRIHATERTDANA
jgi:co-chaperonin GroES (HSP10)